MHGRAEWRARDRKGEAGVLSLVPPDGLLSQGEGRGFKTESEPEVEGSDP
jgi:hypothetical protein